MGKQKVKPTADKYTLIKGEHLSPIMIRSKDIYHSINNTTKGSLSAIHLSINKAKYTEIDPRNRKVNKRKAQHRVYILQAKSCWARKTQHFLFLEISSFSMFVGVRFFKLTSN